MSVANPPTQGGGATVVGAAGVKGLPAAGAKVALEAGHALRGLFLAGAALMGTGAILLRGGRRTERSAGAKLD